MILVAGAEPHQCQGRGNTSTDILHHSLRNEHKRLLTSQFSTEQLYISQQTYTLYLANITYHSQKILDRRAICLTPMRRSSQPVITATETYFPGRFLHSHVNTTLKIVLYILIRRYRTSAGWNTLIFIQKNRYHEEYYEYTLLFLRDLIPTITLRFLIMKPSSLYIFNKARDPFPL